MSFKRSAIVAAAITCSFMLGQTGPVTAAEYFLDDPAVTISGNLAPSGSNFVVDDKWGFADSSAWVWNNLQPGHEFLIAGAFADSLGGGPTNENTGANPASIQLALGNGTYSNVSFLVLSHGFHSTVPPVARVEVVAEGTVLGEVAEDFAASVDYQAGGQRYNWVTLPDSYEVTDGSLTLDFGRAFAANATWYTIGRVQADFAVPPEGLPGDYNDDGIVDAADYVVWRKLLGTDGSLQNDDTAGIGDDDYTRWVETYGTSGGGGSLSSAMPAPEPSGGIVALGTLLLLVIVRRASR